MLNSFRKSSIIKKFQIKYFFRKNKESNTNNTNTNKNPDNENENKEENSNTNSNSNTNDKKDNNNNNRNENKNNKNNNNNNDEKKDSFGFFKISKGTPMIKEEAYKIMNFTENDELTSELIMERYEKYFIINDPNKGGSFYLQNKIFYSKEFLMQDFPKSENKSKYDLNNPIEVETCKEETEGFKKEEKI
jgi:hypothetical protein